MVGATVAACASGAGDASSFPRTCAVATAPARTLEPPAGTIAPLEPNRGATAAAGAALGRLSALSVPGVTSMLAVPGVTGVLAALGSGARGRNRTGAATGATLVALLVATSRACS